MDRSSGPNLNLNRNLSRLLDRNLTPLLSKWAGAHGAGHCLELAFLSAEVDDSRPAVLDDRLHVARFGGRDAFDDQVLRWAVAQMLGLAVGTGQDEHSLRPVVVEREGLRLRLDLVRINGRYSTAGVGHIAQAAGLARWFRRIAVFVAGR